MFQCPWPGKITMIKEKRQQSAEKHKHSPSVPGYPVYPPLVSYSYRTEHITPIPPKKELCTG